MTKRFRQSRHSREGGNPEPLRSRFMFDALRVWIPAFAGMTKKVAPLALLAPLAACAHAVESHVSHAATSPGFVLGVWHGFIFPVAWVLSLFMPDVAIYAVPNQGGWYDFGYFVGIVFLGVGARHSRTVVRTVYVRR